MKVIVGETHQGGSLRLKNAIVYQRRNRRQCSYLHPIVGGIEQEIGSAHVHDGAGVCAWPAHTRDQ